MAAVGGMSSSTDSRSAASSQNIQPQTRIPKLTSQWTPGVLKSLKIIVRTGRLYPLTNIQNDDSDSVNSPLVEWLKDVMLKTRYTTTYNVLKMKVKRALDHLKMYKPLHRLDFESIEQIVDHEAFLFQENMDINCSDITSALPMLRSADHWEKCWYHMFHYNAEKFATDLKYMMILLQEGQGRVPESMYSTLFLDFIGMFGVKGVAEPSFPVQMQSIGDIEVTSSPDIVLLDRLNVKKDTPGAYRTDILSVIKVKSENRDPCNPPPAKLQRRELPSELEREVIVDNDSFYQHVGDLVVERHLSSSDRGIMGMIVQGTHVSQDQSKMGMIVQGTHVSQYIVQGTHASQDQGIMGMIVQGTHVTFTYFSCSKEQIAKVKCGTCDYLDNKPSIMFSESYNYLKASEREHLMETLLILGLLQECG